jgi:hypothetical protein
MESGTEIESPPAETHYQAAHQNEANDEEREQILATGDDAVEGLVAGSERTQERGNGVSLHRVVGDWAAWTSDENSST